VARTPKPVRFGDLDLAKILKTHDTSLPPEPVKAPKPTTVREMIAQHTRKGDGRLRQTP